MQKSRRRDDGTVKPTHNDWSGDRATDGTDSPKANNVRQAMRREYVGHRSASGSQGWGSNEASEEAESEDCVHVLRFKDWDLEYREEEKADDI